MKMMVKKNFFLPQIRFCIIFICPYSQFDHDFGELSSIGLPHRSLIYFFFRRTPNSKHTTETLGHAAVRKKIVKLHFKKCKKTYHNSKGFFFVSLLSLKFLTIFDKQRSAPIVKLEKLKIRTSVWKKDFFGQHILNFQMQIAEEV